MCIKSSFIYGKYKVLQDLQIADRTLYTCYLQYASVKRCKIASVNHCEEADSKCNAWLADTGETITTDRPYCRMPSSTTCTLLFVDCCRTGP